MSCISNWGVEDMIGNYWEWTADWWGQGADGTHDTQPDTYGGDGWSNVDPAEAQGPRSTHFPAVGQRGGNWSYGTRVGAFAMDLSAAPSVSNNSLGFRCALSYHPDDGGGE